MRGVWCATLTPLDAHGDVDAARFAEHVSRLLVQGVDGVVPFGTTGEGSSFSVAERTAGLEALLNAGIPPSRIVVATGCAALPDTIALTRHARALDCAGVLVLPPFFFKDATDDGVYASYAAVIDAVADARLRVYLYHIPQVTAVPLGNGVIERLCAAYPGTIAGVKDSAGDLAHSLELRARFPDLGILVGHEPHLPAMLAAGGAGTVCGLANLFPRTMRRLHDTAETLEEEDALTAIRSMLAILFDYPLLPAFKALMASMTGQSAWRAVRPPLVSLPTGACAGMLDRLREARVI
jgi:4-hydroxy-tetrahydrodipicolinate synthase